MYSCMRYVEQISNGSCCRQCCITFASLNVLSVSCCSVRFGQATVLAKEQQCTLEAERLQGQQCRLKADELADTNLVERKAAAGA